MATFAFRSRALVCSTVAALALTFSTSGRIDVALADQAGAPSVQQIIDALKPRKTRGLSVKPTSAELEKAKVIDDLKTKAATRGLSVPERQQLADAVSGKPSLDFVIYFDFNSAKVSNRSKATLDALGTALKDESLKNAAIMIAGHTDAKGRSEYNQTLSERRADEVRRYLTENFDIPTPSLTVVGYGAERLKNKAAPYASVNRRVQIVNISDKTASSSQPVASDANP